jgi:hypothetical protein
LSESGEPGGDCCKDDKRQSNRLHERCVAYKPFTAHHVEKPKHALPAKQRLDGK